MSDKKKRPKSKAAQATQAAREARQPARPTPPPRPAAEQAASLPERGEPVVAAPHDDIPARFRTNAPDSTEYRGGLLSGMRGGFQSAVGGGPRKKSMTGTIIYILLIMALVAFIWGGY